MQVEVSISDSSRGESKNFHVDIYLIYAADIMPNSI